MPRSCRTRPRAVRNTATLAAVTAVFLTACSSPETTYTGATGQQVTVSWADYPGEAGQDDEQVRRAPTQDEVEELSTDLFDDIEVALTEEYELDWYSREEGDGPLWFRTEGNGYGGESAYTSYNSPQRQATGIPTDPADWDRVVQIVDEVVQDHGLGPLVMHETYAGERQQSAEAYGTDPDGWPYWNGMASGDAGWFTLGLTDRTRRPDTADDDGDGWPARSIDLFYGATTIADDQRATFDERLAPFEGLEQPEATHSD